MNFIFFFYLFGTFDDFYPIVNLGSFSLASTVQLGCWYSRVVKVAIKKVLRVMWHAGGGRAFSCSNMR